MRIANIIEDGRIAGPQIGMIDLAKGIKDAVSTTVIMPTDNSDEFQSRCKLAGIEYKAMPISRITKEYKVAIRYVLFSFFEILRIRKFLKQGGFDLVHVSGGSWQYKGAIAGRLAGIPVLWHLNDSYMPSIFRRMFGMLSGLATGYAYASERTKTYYSPYIKAGRLEFTIPAPVDTRHFDPSQNLPEDELAPLLQNKYVVGTVANISPIKGLETFLHMAATVQEKFGEKAAFVIVGPVHNTQRSYFESLQNLAKSLGLKNFLWAKSRHDVRPLLKLFDVYVCSSQAESSPISVWEAMSMAKPLVSTNVGDVPLYVKDGECGFVLPVGNSEQLANRVEQLFNDSDMRQSFGQTSRKIAQEQLDVTHCCKQHLFAYQQLCPNK